MIPRWIVVVFIILSFVGFLDSTYLTVKHYQGEAPACSVLEGCEQVTSSEFATFGNVPIALFGALYYFFILVASLFVYESENIAIFKYIALFSVVGFLASIMLFYIQVFVIGYICLYCMVSAVSSTTLFILGMRFFGVAAKENNVIQ